jgi:hypothetical protein
VEYINGPFIHSEIPTVVKLKIINTYKVQARLQIHWYTPPGWQVSPAGDCQVLSLPAHLGEVEEIEYQVHPQMLESSTQRAVIEIVIDSRPGVMLVPIILVKDVLKSSR